MRRLATIFAFALGIRLAYDLILYATMGPAGLMGPDSSGYMDLAARLASGETGFFGSGADPVVFNLMPLFPWLLSLTIAMFGATPLPYVLLQAGFDSATCVLVARAAASMAPGLLVPAGGLAAVNPTQIVVAGQIYPDTLFLFFIAAMLVGALAWLRRPAWVWAAAAGVTLGLATFTRMLTLPWAFILPVLLLAGQALGHRLRLAQGAQVALVTLLCVAVVAPIAIRNRVQGDTWMLTDQTGGHLLFWVVPLVREAADGTPIEVSRARIERRAAERGIAGTEPPLELAAARQALALEMLWQAGPVALLEAWTIGAVLNIGTPAAILSPPIAAMPRTGIYATAGENMLDKAWRYVFVSASRDFRAMLVLSAGGVLLWLGLAAAGLASALRSRDAHLLLGIALLVLWGGYILAVNGPVASPKYRLPLEPAWIVLAALGLKAVGASIARRRMVKLDAGGRT